MSGLYDTLCTRPEEEELSWLSQTAKEAIHKDPSDITSPVVGRKEMPYKAITSQSKGGLLHHEMVTCDMFAKACDEDANRPKHTSSLTPPTPISQVSPVRWICGADFFVFVHCADG